MNTKSQPRAVPQKEPLHFTLRAIVALSENMIDDQDPRAVFAPETVSESARAIRQTANGAMTQAIRLQESHAALVAALESAMERTSNIEWQAQYRHALAAAKV